MIINGQIQWVSPQAAAGLTAHARTGDLELLGGRTTASTSEKLWAFAKKHKWNILLLTTVLFALYSVKPIQVRSIIFMLGICALLALNLGTRQAGTLSAYSIYNPGFKSLQGDLRAEHFEAQIRGTPLPAGVRPGNEEEVEQLPRGVGQGGRGQGHVLGGAGQQAGAQEEADDAELQEALRRSQVER